MKKIKTKGQVWIETVIYTLIGLVLLGIILTFAIPEIGKQKDKTIIQNTINVFNELDNTIVEVKRNGVGNVREMAIQLTKGSIIIDSLTDRIIYEMPDSSYLYSELGRDVEISGTNIRVLTEKNGKSNKVSIILDYRSSSRANITFNGKDEKAILNPGSINYNLAIENLGRSLDNGNIVIDISEE